MKDKTTPLMRQYGQIKSRHPDAILLFRMGDFYETFGDDAVITAQVCGIVLTKRNNGEAQEVPLAGFPYHQLDAYVPKIVRAGHRVAICEQLEDPKFAKGIVKRDVTEVITPGVAIHERLLDARRNNYLAAMYRLPGVAAAQMAAQQMGLSFADISTGQYTCMEVAFDQVVPIIESFSPSEILVSKRQDTELRELVDELSYKPVITKQEEWIGEESFARDTLLRHFKTQNLKGFGAEDLHAGLSAAGMVLHYLSETQRGSIAQISALSVQSYSDIMVLDAATRKNLEISSNMADGSREGSLIGRLDKTATSPGARLFRQWVAQPLRSLPAIAQRADMVEAIVLCKDLASSLGELLRSFGDPERLIAKVSAGKAGFRDLVSLRKSLDTVVPVRDMLLRSESVLLAEFAEHIRPETELCDRLKMALSETPPLNAGTGEAFRPGYSAELDAIREAMYEGKNWINQYQADQRAASGISSLKVGFNNVFGYYIEISNTHRSKVPQNFERKQTLANAERYTTPELKAIEQKILNAEERIVSLEQELLFALCASVASRRTQIQFLTRQVARLDCLLSFALAALEYKFVRPVLDDSLELHITNGRHPVVEGLLPIGKSFVANSTAFGSQTERFHVLTGPNMSGKSCYLRQVGLIVLLGQIGSFVPASEARIGLVDRIFTRVGAQDNIVAGESTFLVEMQEAANIVNNATERSLLLLDEIGRGTATFDGISIAVAIAEYIHDKLDARTLFATHYHELNDLAERLEKVCNYKVEVREINGQIIFTHQVSRGSSDHSFGIHVARLAGLPSLVTERASNVLAELERAHPATASERASLPPELSKQRRQKSVAEEHQLSIFEFRDDELRAKIRALQVDRLTPLEALQTLAQLQQHVNKS